MKETISLREYQLEAYKSFVDNNNIGLFEMATGTGKTVTSIYCAEETFKKNNEQFLVIIVPFTHLIDQWIENLNSFNIHVDIRVADSYKKWYPDLQRKIWAYNRGSTNRVVIIGTYKSMAREEFQDELLKIRDSRFLIADECHYIGSKQFKKTYFAKCENRLGLSATPQRWWDDSGTDQVYSIFDKSVYVYSLDKAIEKNYLTSYEYYPVSVDLTNEELEEYSRLTFIITQILREENYDQEKLDSVVRRRSMILKKATNKIPSFQELISKQKVKKHTLVYCAPGQVDEVVKIVSDMGIKTHRFDSTLNRGTRQEVLKDFEKGIIEVLVAIKCLDEGVDVPATRQAYFLASTSNPREFVQRRGRVLRKHPNKNKSIIYDFIVLPENEEFGLVENIAKKEIPRFAEFSLSAVNKYSARKEIGRVLSKFNLEYMMDYKPWDIYKLSKEHGDDD